MQTSKRSMRAAVIVAPSFEGENEINLEDPRVKAAIQAAAAEAVATETSGLRANRDEILEEKRKTKDQLDQLTAQWSGMDATQVKALMSRMENDEDTRLIAEGKVDEVIERRVTAMRTDFEGQLSQATEALTTHEGANQILTGRVKRLLIERDLIAGAAKLGVRPEAMPDVISRAGGIFVLDETGEELEAREGEVLLKGKDGKSKLTPSEWLEGRKTDCPHWWPGSQGAGSSGGGGGRDLSKEKLDGMSGTQLLKTAIAQG